MRGKRSWCCVAAIAVVAGAGAGASALAAGESSEELVTMPVSAAHAEEVHETLVAVMATPPDDGDPAE